MGVVHAKELKIDGKRSKSERKMSKYKQDTEKDIPSGVKKNDSGRRKQTDSTDPFGFSKVKTRVDRIHVDGLARTKDDIVKSQVTGLFKSNNFADLVQEIHIAYGKLSSIGCFNNIHTLIDTSNGPGATPEGVEVTFFVEETKRLIGGVETSVGNNDGSVSIGMKAPNMFGRGERLECQYSYGMKLLDVQMSLIKPLVDSKLNTLLTGNVFTTSSSYPWSSFNQRDMGFLCDLSLSPPLSKLKHNFQYEACVRHLKCAKQAAHAVREQCGPTLKSAIKYLFTIDRRDETIFPTEGNYLQYTMELAGLGGNIGFLKNELHLQSNWSPADFLTFQLGFQTGLLRRINNGKKITIADHFFLGGPLNLRGFDTRGCGPRRDSSSLGGDMYWALALHMYTPLPFRPRRGLCNLFRLHGFINAGNLLKNDTIFSNSYNDIMRIMTTNMRCAIGAGLAINLGNSARIELNMCLPLRYFRSDVLQRCQLGFGIQYL